MINDSRTHNFNALYFQRLLMNQFHGILRRLIGYKLIVSILGILIAVLPTIL